MSKLKMEYKLAETQIRTDACSARVKITPINKTEVEIQFGHFSPTSQVASAADLRELASIFLEVAELLEGDSKPLEEAARPEKDARTICVKSVPDAKNLVMHGVFSELTDEQAEALEHAIQVMNAALPWGRYIYVTY